MVDIRWDPKILFFGGYVPANSYFSKAYPMFKLLLKPY